MPKVSKRSKRKGKRTEKVTVIFTPEEIDLIEKAAARSLETRSTWAYRRLVFAARTELATDGDPKK